MVRRQRAIPKHARGSHRATAGPAAPRHADPLGHAACFARHDPHRWLMKEALPKPKRCAEQLIQEQLASRDIPPLIREAEQEPGAGRQSPSSGCSLTATAWITPLGDARVGHGKFTAASSPAGKGMQGKFTRVQPEPGPERQV